MGIASATVHITFDDGSRHHFEIETVAELRITAQHGVPDGPTEALTELKRNDLAQPLLRHLSGA